MAAAGTMPTTAELTEWIVWADGKVKSYLQTGDTLPTDQGDIIKNTVDNLLIQKYVYEKRVGFNLPNLELDKHLPYIRPSDKEQLDSLKGQDSSIEDPAFNFDTQAENGGFD